MEEEVAFAAVTSYMVTLFVMRSMNVSEKHVYVSDPVWSHETGPSTRACWFNFMYEAQQCHQGATRCGPVIMAEEQPSLTFLTSRPIGWVAHVCLLSLTGGLPSFRSHSKIEI